MTDLKKIMRFSRKPKTVVNNVTNVFEFVPPLRLEPGDTLIVQCERRVPRDVFLKLQAQIKERYPGGNVIVLEAGLKAVGVIEGVVR